MTAVGYAAVAVVAGVTSGESAVLSIPIEDGSRGTTLLSGPGEMIGATDGESSYVLMNGGTRGSLVKYEKGGAMRTLAESPTIRATHGIAVDTAFVYYLDGTTLYRVAK